MKCIKSIMILYLAFNLLGCKNKINVEEDIKAISQINKNVKDVQGLLLDSIDLKNIFLTEIYKNCYEYNNFVIKANIDSTFNLTYTKLISKDSVYYYGVSFTKRFFEGNKFHVIELFNKDTLYHYTTVKSVEDSYFFTDYTFKKGKYFFMFERSRKYDRFGQKIFFYNNYDSLVNVRGNIAPALPSIDSISMEDFHESEFYKNFKKGKPYLF